LPNADDRFLKMTVIYKTVMLELIYCEN